MHSLANYIHVANNFDLKMSSNNQLLLLLRPPPSYFIPALSSSFQLLKPWESPLPLSQFLATHTTTVRAVLITGLVPVNAVILNMLPRLGLVITASAGVSHIDLDECRRRGVDVAFAGAVFAEDVADYAVVLLIDVLRRISAANRYVRSRQWMASGDYPLGFKVSGKRVGIVGLGIIGTATARRLEAFGCIISYTSRTKKPAVAYKYFTNVLELAAASNVLLLTCALNNKTYHIINKKVMSALGHDGIIINVSRGALIDEQELVQHLIEGKIGGAGLDVFEHEPAMPHKLWTMDNVVLSNHTATCTSETFSNLLRLMIDNLEAFFSNRPLLTPVLEN